jgi:predicted RNA binding protein YcfA (HicA-like mRNA interferase family)
LIEKFGSRSHHTFKKHECSFRGGTTPPHNAPESQNCTHENSGPLKLIEGDGWLLRNQEGSHRQFVHPVKPGKVAGHPSAEVDPKTKASILKQAGIK